MEPAKPATDAEIAWMQSLAGVGIDWHLADKLIARIRVEQERAEEWHGAYDVAVLVLSATQVARDEAIAKSARLEAALREIEDVRCGHYCTDIARNALGEG